jgi:hypothetical protein
VLLPAKARLDNRPKTSIKASGKLFFNRLFITFLSAKHLFVWV